MYQRSVARLVVYTFFSLLIGRAHAADSYLGQKVLPKYEHLNARVGSAVVATEMDFDWPVAVERVNGQWLLIKDDGHYSVVGQPTQGWVSKNDVLLLEGIDPIANKTALEYLTGCLTRDRYAGWAYWLRGLIFANNQELAAAIADEEQATRYAGWLDGAWEWLAWCEYRQTLVDHAGIFAKVRSHEKRYLSWDEVPEPIHAAVAHYKRAASICPRPQTFRDWGDALSIQDWNQFQRFIWIFYLEDPEKFLEDQNTEKSLAAYLARYRECDPLISDKAAKSAVCLYERALRFFPSYADALYSRGGLFEYVADHEVYRMTQEPSWKILTKAEEITQAKQRLRLKQAELSKLNDDLQPIVEEMDRLAALRHDWRIKQVDEKRKQKQTEIDRVNTDIDMLNLQITGYNKTVSHNQAAINKMQTDALTRIKHLTDQTLRDFAAAVAANQKDPEASRKYLRDRAAVSLMLLDPTGLRQIRGFRDSPLDFGRAEIASSASAWSQQAAEAYDYEDQYTLATLAAASNATGSFKEAIRRERSAWDLMNNEERTFAVPFIELYTENDSNAQKKPK